LYHYVNNCFTATYCQTKVLLWSVFSWFWAKICGKNHF